MLVSMIVALAQPVVLAMSLYSGAESLTTVMLPQAVPAAPVAEEPVVATKEDLAEITAPGTLLSQYLTPAAKTSMCVAFATALGTGTTSDPNPPGAQAAMNEALRDCNGETSSNKGVESTPSTKTL
ncbi:MAG: hypothetical protein ACNJA3_28595 (plasmid) [Pseudomonas rhizophila]|uniref:hypothetical protein n=1 Tax=Pseudomonas rhizophila TaxID=2045200 RepID=UPI003F6D6D91